MHRSILAVELNQSERTTLLRSPIPLSLKLQFESSRASLDREFSGHTRFGCRSSRHYRVYREKHPNARRSLWRRLEAST